MNRDGTLDKHDVAPSSVADELRAKAWSEEGLWFVSRFLVGNTRLVERIHKPRLNWLQKQVSTPDALFCDCDPRMSGKTDSFTIALPLWAWAMSPLPNSPIQGIDTCIAMCAPKKDIAAYIFVVSVMERFEKCDAYRKLFPWIEPDPKHWSRKNGLRLKSSRVTGLPNLLPLGMESVSTSLHPPILIVDDPIHEQNYRSAAEVARIVSWIEHSHALTGPVHGARGFIGNKWTFGDAQANVRPWNKGYEKAQVWERGVTGCAACVTNRFPLDERDERGNDIKRHEHTGEVFPIALARDVAPNPQDEGPHEPASFIEDVRAAKPTFIFLTQHENRLVDPSTLQLRKEWLKKYDWVNVAEGERMLRVPVSAQAFTASRNGPHAHRFSSDGYGLWETIPLSALDIYVLVDPAPTEEEAANRSRFAAVVLAGEKRGMRRFLLDEYADNKPQHMHLDWLLDAYLKWRPRKFGIESVGYQATIRDALLTTARGRGIVTLRESDIIMLPRLRTEGAQEDRIKYALVPLTEAGHLYYHPSLSKFRVEYDYFGVKGSKHDILDAMSNFDRTAGASGRRTGTGQSNAAVEEARRRRSNLGPTGYGS